jgi:hypothetical protein
MIIVSFHGNYRMTEEIRFKNLRNYLNFFQYLKKLTKSKYLIVGGDFNLDMDEYSAQKKLDNKGNVKMTETILKDLGLKIVPYESQRKKKNGERAKKIDALICDKKLRCDEVVVFHNSREEEEENLTRVLPSEIPPNVLDHDPVMFKLWIPEKREISSPEKLVNFMRNLRLSQK